MIKHSSRLYQLCVQKPTYFCDMPQNQAFTSHLTAEAIEPEKQARRGAHSRQHRNVFSSLYISWVSEDSKKDLPAFSWLFNKKHFYSQSLSKSKSYDFFFFSLQIARKEIFEGSSKGRLCCNLIFILKGHPHIRSCQAAIPHRGLQLQQQGLTGFLGQSPCQTYSACLHSLYAPVWSLIWLP